MKETVLDNDGDLLRRMAGDDQSAFTTLYRRHWESLFVTTVRVIGNKEDAEDIIQEVFASLWNRRRSLDLTGPLAGYLQVSVKYKAINYIDKNITRRHYLQALSKAAETGAPASPEVLLRVKEVQQLIQTVIENMPPKMREVYQLSRQQQLTHKEIATRLGISEETVKKHIQNALQLLRSAMGKAPASIPALLFYLLS
ncbi:RNA polymerase sigma factor [Puia dinghuensis]|uniref:DNA-directed RNA polymerase sigma-70 factor n=1 Tax=Puia dinghuensis TaxID=1792502 RepID=A0A8J2XTD1_9BACT|nr:RNA polymerase sigma-70 factor [Puia dinghuensis]GGB02490.1 DNA-directed RNA polymerase sigma-70 factor [Puia dinghuensis]